jgi:hypothetical protein
MIRSTVRRATNTTKLVLAAIVACMVFGGVNGFAASFGTGTGGFAAGDSLVASCGNGMTFAYATAFNEETSGYVVEGINLSNIPSGCLGRSVSVTFDSGNNTVGSAVAAILPASGTTQSIVIPPNSKTIDASQISGVSVVIS